MSWLPPDSVYALFGQREVWIDQQHEQHRIAEIDDRYLLNLERFVRKNAKRLGVVAWSLPVPNFNGDMAQFYAEQETEVAEARLFGWAADPDSCPLVEALNDEIDRRGLRARAAR